MKLPNALPKNPPLDIFLSHAAHHLPVSEMVQMVLRRKENAENGMLSMVVKRTEDPGHTPNEKTIEAALEKIRGNMNAMRRIEEDYNAKLDRERGKPHFTIEKEKIGKEQAKPMSWEEYQAVQTDYFRQLLRKESLNLLKTVYELSLLKAPDNVLENSVPGEFWLSIAKNFWATDVMTLKTTLGGAQSRIDLTGVMKPLGQLIPGNGLEAKIQAAKDILTDKRRDADPLLAALYLDLAAASEIQSAQNSTLLTLFFRKARKDETLRDNFSENMKMLAGIAEELDRRDIIIPFAPYTSDHKFWKDIASGVIGAQDLLDGARMLREGMAFHIDDLSYCARFSKDMKNHGISQYRDPGDRSRIMEWLTGSVLPKAFEEDFGLDQDKVEYKISRENGALLYNKFGISNFDRYPNDVLNYLAKSAKEGKAAGRLDRNAIVIMNKEDLLGAFSSEQIKSFFSEILRQGYSLTIHETSNDLDAMSTISSAWKQNAENLVVFGMHANSPGGFLGSTDSERSRISLSDRDTVRESRPPINSTNTVVLLACKSGEGKENLESMFREEWRGRNFAIPFSGNLESYSFGKDGLLSDVRFAKGSTTPEQIKDWIMNDAQTSMTAEEKAKQAKTKMN